MFSPQFEFGGWQGEADRTYSFRVMRIALDALIKANGVYFLEHPEAPDPRQSGIRYVHNGVHDEPWRAAPRLLETLEGDCKSIVAYYVAWLRLRRGVRARAIFTMRMHLEIDAAGQRAYRPRVHVLYQLDDTGEIFDPSKDHGMMGDGGS